MGRSGSEEAMVFYRMFDHVEALHAWVRTVVPKRKDCEDANIQGHLSGTAEEVTMFLCYEKPWIPWIMARQCTVISHHVPCSSQGCQRFAVGLPALQETQL